MQWRNRRLLQTKIRGHNQNHFSTLRQTTSQTNTSTRSIHTYIRFTNKPITPRIRLETTKDNVTWWISAYHQSHLQCNPFYIYYNYTIHQVIQTYAFIHFKPDQYLYFKLLNPKNTGNENRDSFIDTYSRPFVDCFEYIIVHISLYDISMNEAKSLIISCLINACNRWCHRISLEWCEYMHPMNNFDFVYGWCNIYIYACYILWRMFVAIYYVRSIWSCKISHHHFGNIGLFGGIDVVCNSKWDLMSMYCIVSVLNWFVYAWVVFIDDDIALTMCVIVAILVTRGYDGSIVCCWVAHDLMCWHI